MRTRVAPVLLVCLTLVACATLSVTATPAGAPDLAPLATVALPRTRGPLVLRGATGTTLVTGPGVNLATAVSPDNGQTQQATPAAMRSLVAMTAAAGVVIGFTTRVEQTPDEPRVLATGVRVWTPADGLVRDMPYAFGVIEDDDQFLGAFNGRLLLLGDGRVFDLSGSAVVPVTATAPPTPRASWWWEDYGLTDDGRSVVAWKIENFGRTDRYGYVSVGRTDGTPGVGPVRITGLVDAAVSGQRIRTLIGTATRLAVCTASVDRPSSRTCVTVRLGDYRRFIGGLDAFGADVLVHARYVTTKPSALWLVRGTTVRRLSAPSGTLYWRVADVRDPARPLVIAFDRRRGDLIHSVGTDGRLTRLLQSPLVASPIDGAALTPARVTAFDRRPVLQPGSSPLPEPLWFRTLGQAQFGPETLVPGRSWQRPSGVLASGGRVAVQAQDRAYLFDRDRYVRSLPTGIDTTASTLSGPFLLIGDRVYRVDRSTPYPGRVDALFGSLAARVASGVLEVRDLVRPSQAPVRVTLPAVAGRTYGSYVAMWGDWVLIGWYGGNGETSGRVLVNYRTKAVRAVDDAFFDVGDGYLIRSEQVSDAVYRLVFVSIADGTTVRTPGGERVITDGQARVLWVGPEDLSVAAIPFGGRSAPRLLGVIAPNTLLADGKHRWRPQLDVSKQITVGTLEFRDAAGRLVRSLPTYATTRGALRTVSWDGRNASGRLVKAGTYTWTLNVEAQDGTGRVTAVDGLGPAAGTVKVTR